MKGKAREARPSGSTAISVAAPMKRHGSKPAPSVEPADPTPLSFYDSALAVVESYGCSFDDRSNKPEAYEWMLIRHDVGTGSAATPTLGLLLSRRGGQALRKAGNTGPYRSLAEIAAYVKGNSWPDVMLIPRVFRIS